MKKRIISLTVALLMCLCVNGTVMAQTNAFGETANTIGIKSIANLMSGLTKVSGYTNRYNPWAAASASSPEQMTVGFALYRVVNNTEVYITSGNNSGYGTYIKASNTVILTAGTYKLYAYYEGETQSSSSIKTYSVS